MVVEPMQGTLDSIPNPGNKTKKHYNAQKAATIKGYHTGARRILRTRGKLSFQGWQEKEKEGPGSKQIELCVSGGVTTELSSGV